MGASGGDKLETLDTTNYADRVRYNKRIGKGVEHIGTGNYVGQVTMTTDCCVCFGDNTSITRGLVCLGGGDAIFFEGFESRRVGATSFPKSYKFVSPTKIVLDWNLPFFHVVNKEPKGLASCFS